MAEIVEVIHRINYEVNDNGIRDITTQLGQQLTALLKLQNQLTQLQKELGRTTETQSTEFEKISRNIARIGQLLQRELGKSKSFLEKYGVDIVKGLGLDEKIGNAVVSWVRPAQKQLGGLAKTSASVGGALLSTAGKLTPLGRAISVAIPIVLELATSFFKVEESTDKLNDAIEDVGEQKDKVAQFAADEIKNLLTLKAKIEDVNLGYDKRMEAVRLMKEQNPGFFDHLREEEILLGKVGNAYERIVKNILNKARLAALEDEMNGQVAQLITLQRKIETLAKSEGMSLAVKDSGIPGFREFGFKNDEKIILPNTQKPVDGTTNRNKSLWPQAPSKPVPELKQPSLDLRAAVSAYTRMFYLLRQLLGELIEVQSEIVETTSGKGRSKPGIRIDRTTNEKPREFPLMDVRQTPIESLPRPEIQAKKAELPKDEKKKTDWERLLFGDSKDIENSEERRRNEIKKSIEAYQTLANAAIQTFQSIYDAQIKELDAEIAIRQRRVEAATKLAERGNTEALKLEEDRLAKAEKQREEYAKKQRMLNAALAVSSAILAVAQTAAETGPGSIVMVPAVIAAILAGYVAISAATKESSAQAYADGVIDFQGKGGPRDDANWVRISSGESVITAKGTAANRSILEAINKGAEFKMLDAQLPAAVPVAAGGQASFASKESLKGLEKKLDGVIDAVKDSKLKQDIFFNEHGVGLMTQRVIRRDQNRFK